ncbi:MAG: DNA polymerase IV [bacterium]|nr:DNA polymerase IV [bacterium]
MGRQIIHADMDEFFAAVEKLDNPTLRGKPLLVGGDPAGRGVVATASYEARKFGCHSAMPMARAVRICPDAVVLPVRGKRYRQVSEEIFEIMGEFTPLVERLSIDEAFLDITGSQRLLGPASEVAADVKTRIKSRTGLTVSVGLAPNKFLAKLASDLDKPDGLTIIEPDRIHEVLDPLDIRKLWGVGPAAAKRFEKLNIRTIGQLRHASSELIRTRLGSGGQQLQRLSAGLDDRPVTPDSRAKSIGQEQTFRTDIDDLTELSRILLDQTEQVSRRLRRSGLKARTVTLKLRYGDFTTLTRSVTLDSATDVTELLWRAARGLLDNWASGQSHPLRLLGMTASQLAGSGGVQGSLFSDPGQETQQRIDRAVDEIANRFGDGAINRGGPK